MALPASGILSLSDIRGEFGGSTPDSLSEYYSAASGVPASGTISISDFYGTSSGPVLVTKSRSDHEGTINTYTGGVTFWEVRTRDRTYYAGTSQSTEMGWLDKSGDVYPAVLGSKASLYNNNSSYDDDFRAYFTNNGTVQEFTFFEPSDHRGNWKEVDVGGVTWTYCDFYSVGFQNIKNYLDAGEGWRFYWLYTA